MNFNIDRKAGNSDTSIRWVQEQMDDLDVRIAQRDFEEAVKGIEKGASLSQCFWVNVRRSTNTRLNGAQTSHLFSSIFTPPTSNPATHRLPFPCSGFRIPPPVLHQPLL